MPCLWNLLDSNGSSMLSITAMIILLKEAQEKMKLGG